MMSTITLRLALFLSTLCLAQCLPNKLQQRAIVTPKPSTGVANIMGGTPVFTNQSSYEVSIQIYEKGFWIHSCAGAIVNTRYVITAAHCLLNRSVSSTPPPKYDTSNVRLIAGTNINVKYQRNDPVFEGTAYYVENFLIIDSFNYTTNANDLGLIKVNQSIALNENVTTAKFYFPSTVTNGSAVSVSGWGVTTSTSDIYPVYLQVINTTIQPCSPNYKAQPDEFCTADASNNTQTGICKGDGGSPLVLPNTNIVLGLATKILVSDGASNCGPGYTNIFTNTTTNLLWILYNSFVVGDKLI